MSTSGSELREEIIAAWRGATVATASGLAALVWGSTTIPHVFDGARRGFIGGRNRGRCPFVEIHLVGQRFPQTTADGGTMTSVVEAVIHAADRNAETILDAIAVAGLAAMRSTPDHGYTSQGGDDIGDVEPGPFGWRLRCRSTIEHSYDRDTFEAL